MTDTKSGSSLDRYKQHPILQNEQNGRRSRRKTSADHGYRCSGCSVTKDMLYYNVEDDDASYKLPDLYCNTCQNQNPGKKWTVVTSTDFSRFLEGTREQ